MFSVLKFCMKVFKFADCIARSAAVGVDGEVEDVDCPDEPVKGRSDKN